MRPFYRPLLARRRVRCACVVPARERPGRPVHRLPRRPGRLRRRVGLRRRQRCPRSNALRNTIANDANGEGQHAARGPGLRPPAWRPLLQRGPDDERRVPPPARRPDGGRGERRGQHLRPGRRPGLRPSRDPAGPSARTGPSTPQMLESNGDGTGERHDAERLAPGPGQLGRDVELPADRHQLEQLAAHRSTTSSSTATTGTTSASRARTTTSTSATRRSATSRATISDTWGGASRSSGRSRHGRVREQLVLQHLLRPVPQRARAPVEFLVFNHNTFVNFGMFLVAGWDLQAGLLHEQRDGQPLLLRGRAWTSTPSRTGATSSRASS